MTRNLPWPSARLGDVAQIQTGLAKGKQPEEGKGISVPYLRVANVQDGYVDLAEIKTVLVETQALHRYSLQDGDVLFTEGGDADKLGRGCVWKAQIKPCLHQNHIFSVRASRDVLLPSFLAAHAAGPLGKSYFLNCAKQTTNLASINSTQLRNFPVPIPPLGEQRKIAAILSSLDDAIEATQAVIDQLQVVKKAMMTELLTRGLPGRHTRFKKTEIGEVPEEWTTITYAELAADLPGAIQSGPFGSELRHSEFQDRGYLVIGIDNVLDGRFSRGSNHRISEQKFRELERFRARPLDLLITVMGTVGRCCVIPQDIDPAIITKHVYRLSVNLAKADSYFLMCCLYGIDRLAAEVRGSAQGLTRPGLNKSLLLPLRFPLPPLDEQKHIVAAVQAIDERLDSERISLESLRSLRSALQSALLTGEIRVTPAPDEAAP
jgi:type I restriction enzyme, S subunit